MIKFLRPIVFCLFFIYIHFASLFFIIVFIEIVSKYSEDLSEADILNLNLILKASTFKDEGFPCVNVPTAAKETSISPSMGEEEEEESECQAESEEEKEWFFDLVDEELAHSLKQGKILILSSSIRTLISRA